MIYFENEAAILYVFPERNFAATQWKGFASSAMLREVLQKALDLISDHAVYYWLSDNRNMKVIRPADQEYINTEWLQEFISRSEVRKSASLEPEDVFGKISTENIKRVADQLIPFDTAFFNNLEEATQWLGVEIKGEELAA